MSIQNVSSLQSMIMSALTARTGCQPRATGAIATTTQPVDSTASTNTPTSTTTPSAAPSSTTGVMPTAGADPAPAPTPTPTPAPAPTRGHDCCEISHEARRACGQQHGVRGAEHSREDGWQISPERATRLAEKFAARAERLEARAQKLLDDDCSCNDGKAEKLMKRAERAWSLAEKFAAMIPGNEEDTTPPTQPTTPTPTPATNPVNTTPTNQPQSGTQLNLVG